MTCCIKVCRNYKRRLKTMKKVTFHRLPNKPSLRERWVEIIRQSRGEDHWNPARHSLICSDHFRAKDLYFTSNQSRQRLKRQAIPCKALFLSSTKSDDDESGDEVSNITKDLITTNKSDDTTTINSDGRAEYEVIIKTEPESDEETASTSHVEEGVERKWSHTLEFSNHQVMNTQVATDSPAPRANHVEKDINNTFDLSRIKVDPQALEWMERLSKLPPQLRLLTEKAINDVILRAELGNAHEE
ncbi:unnamed protein product [Leptidea sinapis]|uniref:THAP-type domain-containing protein n=1 Tax=Leptidea sinapis TaxID=189913 RepID=A0A5E4QJY6_9NEOP|nr:unnamed protein product [Leptidea sinapis]